ncbi:MAG: hypothetical protein JKX85_08430, partial [Phycisphaeraceae bacterium]|nr:hypothetical protein [Phycisphaeraceae bacterium]
MKYKVPVTTGWLLLIVMSMSLLTSCSKQHVQQVDTPVTSQKPEYARKLGADEKAL